MALLAFVPAAVAQSIHTQAIGTEVSGSVRFARSEVPLPPGTWVLVSAGVEQSVGGALVRTPYVSLARIERGALAGLVTMSGSLQAENVQWTRNRDCDRTDFYHAEADRNYNTADQHCHHATHYVRSWTASDNQPEQIRAMIAGLRAKSIALPPTMIVSFHWRVVRGEFLTVTYEVSPASIGGPVARINAWSSSEWHKDKVAENPEHKRFLDAWVDWSKQMAPKVREGFGRSLSGYAPIALAYSPPAGAPTQAAARPAPAPPNPSQQNVAARPVSGDFRAPVVGTRFVWEAGHFDVASVEGMIVTMRNARMNNVTWQPGGLIPMGTGTRFDRALVESIFPLSIGKKIEFQQSLNGGTDAWRQSLEVVRTEDLLVDGRAYRTFVVERRTEAIGPGMAEFVRKRTLWYSPEVGWHLRLREEQLSGPPQPLSNWRVVRIVPPS